MQHITLYWFVIRHWKMRGQEAKTSLDKKTKEIQNQLNTESCCQMRSERPHCGQQTDIYKNFGSSCTKYSSGRSSFGFVMLSGNIAWYIHWSSLCVRVLGGQRCAMRIRIWIASEVKTWDAKAQESTNPWQNMGPEWTNLRETNLWNCCEFVSPATGSDDSGHRVPCKHSPHKKYSLEIEYCIKVAKNVMIRSSMLKCIYNHMGNPADCSINMVHVILRQVIDEVRSIATGFERSALTSGDAGTDAMLQVISSPASPPW